MKRSGVRASILAGILCLLAACGSEEGGPERSAWLGQYDVAWACITAACTTVPDVSISTTVMVVADPNTDDRLNLAFTPTAASSGIIGQASPAGDGYQITQLFDRNGSWGAMTLELTATGFTGSATFTPTGASATEWTLTATGPR